MCSELMTAWPMSFTSWWLSKILAPNRYIWGRHCDLLQWLLFTQLQKLGKSTTWRELILNQCFSDDMLMWHGVVCNEKTSEETAASKTMNHAEGTGLNVFSRIRILGLHRTSLSEPGVLSFKMCLFPILFWPCELATLGCCALCY